MQVVEDDESSDDEQTTIGLKAFRELAREVQLVRRMAERARAKLNDAGLGPSDPSRDLLGEVAAGTGNENQVLMNAKARMGLMDLQDRVRKSLATYEVKIHERLEHVELLKIEQRNELKRLQRQHMLAVSDYDKQKDRIMYLGNKVSDFDTKLSVSEAAMATIFKLLRIQYALAHQDEQDK